jgi:hypothetical protein
MITKFVLVVWLGYGHSQVMSLNTFDTQSECEAVANVLEINMERSGWYRCIPYSFERE